MFLLLVRLEQTSSSLQLDVMLYTTEALQPIKYAFLLLVRLELISHSLQLDVIQYTTEALQPIKINSCFWLDLN
jgi:phage gp46-like protein